MATVPHSASGPAGPTNGPQTDADATALLPPATLADLDDLRAELGPCWCPDAPDRHLPDCHLEAVRRLAKQQRCRAGGGGLFMPGGIGLNCDCPTCRIEMGISYLGDVLVAGLRDIADAIRSLDVDLPHSHEHDIRENEVGGDDIVILLDLRERYREVIRALERHGSSQDSDGKWNCPHPRP